MPAMTSNRDDNLPPASSNYDDKMSKTVCSAAVCNSNSHQLSSLNLKNKNPASNIDADEEARGVPSERAGKNQLSCGLQKVWAATECANSLNHSIDTNANYNFKGVGTNHHISYANKSTKLD